MVATPRFPVYRRIVTGEGEVSASNPLPISLAAGDLDDAVKTDDAAFTPATDKVLMIGAEADETGPDSVDEGDAGALRMTLARALHVNLRNASGTEIVPANLGAVSSSTATSVNSAATSTTLLASNTARKGVTIRNTDANALYLGFGVAATTAMPEEIPGGATWEMPLPIFTGQLNGIWSADGSGAALIREN